jgi:hypothetical protein
VRERREEGDKREREEGGRRRRRKGKRRGFSPNSSEIRRVRGKSSVYASRVNPN